MRLAWFAALAAAVVTLPACADDGGGVGPDAAPDAGTCGDGVIGADEACDGDTRACTDLAGSFSAGTATCRADCSGYDVTACTAENGARFEVVKPAERDPRWATARCNDGTPFSAFVRITPG